MLLINCPKNKRLVWYLAMEEYLAKHATEDVFFTWVVDPTVIFGRHQVMEAEVNLDYCKAHHIAVYRRKSGGGCVYADRGNLMMSFIATNTHSEVVFQSFLDRVASVLNDMGYSAYKSGHNDIMVDDYKVSGNACYALPTATIVHGTMLVDVNFEALQMAITPSAEKLAKHGVKSVRQRVMNLHDKNAELTTERMQNHLMSAFGTHTRDLTTDEITAIDEIEATYLDPLFIQGKESRR